MVDVDGLPGDDVFLGERRVECGSAGAVGLALGARLEGGMAEGVAGGGAVAGHAAGDGGVAPSTSEGWSRAAWVLEIDSVTSYSPLRELVPSQETVRSEFSSKVWLSVPPLVRVSVTVPAATLPACRRCRWRSACGCASRMQSR